MKITTIQEETHPYCIHTKILQDTTRSKRNQYRHPLRMGVLTIYVTMVTIVKTQKQAHN